MNELDKILNAPDEIALPPLVRDLQQRTQAGEDIKLEVHRPDTGGGEPYWKSSVWIASARSRYMKWSGMMERMPL